MMSRPVIACLDMEGVLVPEIWVNVAQKTGIRELSLTTRDVPDYDLLMKQLAYPTLFCNRLEVDADGRIINYHLRLPDQKRQSVAALKRLRFMVVAAGDSYNDTSMLAEADAGILFRPPDTIIKEFPQFPVTRTFAELKEQFCKAGGLRP